MNRYEIALGRETKKEVLQDPCIKGDQEKPRKRRNKKLSRSASLSLKELDIIEDFFKKVDKFKAMKDLPSRAVRKKNHCRRCGGSGVIETGNNDLPCDCPAGDKAVFNVSGFYRPLTGKEIKKLK
jgi:hypothetical protein